MKIYRKFAKIDAPTTVNILATTIERLLMAPSISSMSMVLVVSMAWAEVPIAISFAIDS